jgi:hypothetical protein
MNVFMGFEWVEVGFAAKLRYRIAKSRSQL